MYMYFGHKGACMKYYAKMNEIENLGHTMHVMYFL